MTGTHQAGGGLPAATRLYLGGNNTRPVGGTHAGRRHVGRGHPSDELPDLAAPGRVCAHPNCTTVLSVYNRTAWCFPHELNGPIVAGVILSALTRSWELAYGTLNV